MSPMGEMPAMPIMEGGGFGQSPPGGGFGGGGFGEPAADPAGAFGESNVASTGEGGMFDGMQAPEAANSEEISGTVMPQFDRHEDEDIDMSEEAVAMRREGLC